jgi:hypothetical protein
VQLTHALAVSNSVDYPSDVDNVPYLSVDDVDFSRMYSVFRALPLFDDMYLNMQAMNISMVDGFITDQEYALLRQYFEIEKTPTQQAMFVSAQSQMWIFALYELLRTWKTRMRKLKQWKESGALKQMLERVENDERNLGALMRSRHIEWAIEDEKAIQVMEAAEALMNDVYEMTSAIRINLAKHEVQGKPNRIVRAPGYGRINGFCGALDYELDLGDEYFRYINRRDIADRLRKVNVSKSDDS